MILKQSEQDYNYTYIVSMLDVLVVALFVLRYIRYCLFTASTFVGQRQKDIMVVSGTMWRP